MSGSTPSKGRSCAGKRRHTSRAGAEAHVGRLVRERGAPEHRLEIYACRHCDGFHVGHGPRGKR